MFADIHLFLLASYCCRKKCPQAKSLLVLSQKKVVEFLKQFQFQYCVERKITVLISLTIRDLLFSQCSIPPPKKGGGRQSQSWMTKTKACAPCSSQGQYGASYSIMPAQFPCVAFALPCFISCLISQWMHSIQSVHTMELAQDKHLVVKYSCAERSDFSPDL